MKVMKAVLLMGIFAIIIVGGMLGLKYSGKFTQDSNTTATQGIFFKKTLNLEHYKNVSSGLGMWGYYDNYTRSDRHTEVITVYCNDYCKKK